MWMLPQIAVLLTLHGYVLFLFNTAPMVTVVYLQLHLVLSR